MNRAFLIAALLGAGCVPENGPLMDPGKDCLECHGGGQSDGPGWSAAGTFGGKGSRVWIRDATGWSFTLPTAENGNFYTAEELVYPIRVAVDGEEMEDDVPSPLSTTACIDDHCCAGSRCGCNDCHGEDDD
jgi:hypothetical protein